MALEYRLEELPADATEAVDGDTSGHPWIPLFTPSLVAARAASVMSCLAY
jgi:hypothetical protein